VVTKRYGQRVFKSRTIYGGTLRPSTTPRWLYAIRLYLPGWLRGTQIRNKRWW